MALPMTRRQFVGKSVQGAAIVAAGKFFVVDSWPRATGGAQVGTAYRGVFSELDKFVEQYMRAMNSPGMTLVLADREGVQRVATYGFGDLQAKIAVKPDELFQIGSISKSFVANCASAVTPGREARPEEAGRGIFAVVSNRLVVRADHHAPFVDAYFATTRDSIAISFRPGAETSR